VQIDSHDDQSHYDLASVLLEARQYGAAVDEFRAALELQPGSAEAHNNLGIALASQGKLGEASAQFQQALALRPDFEDASRNLASAVRARSTPAFPATRSR
jgi:Tfp pilus assembly protein PilF